MENKNTELTAEVKKRGFWLSAFLILMFIANPFSAYTYFGNPEEITNVFSSATTSIIYFLGFISIVNIALAAGVWTWRKWGVYGFYIVAVVVFIINIYIGIGIVASLMGLIGALILFLTTKSRWEYFS